MPVLDGWDLLLDADAVLRGQGADPAVIRKRNPRLYEIAVDALEECLSLIHPKVLYERFTIESIRHTQIRLKGGILLKSELLTRQLGMAEEILAIVCTIGPQLEELASRVMVKEMVRGLAIYGVGSASVEALANAACQRFETEAALRGWESTMPVSPGAIGWSVEEGQPQIFSLLNPSRIGAQLTDASIMLPMKLLSMVIGLGFALGRQGTTCDFCAMHDCCKYRDANVSNRKANLHY